MHIFNINPLKDPGAGIIELGMSRNNVRSMMSMLGEEEKLRLYDEDGEEHIFDPDYVPEEGGEDDEEDDDDEDYETGSEDDDDEEDRYIPGPRYGYDFTIRYSQNARVRSIDFDDPEIKNWPYEVYLFGYNVFKTPAQTLIQCLIDNGGVQEKPIDPECYAFAFPRSVTVFLGVCESEGNNPDYWPQITPGTLVASSICIWGSNPDDDYRTDEEKGQLSLPF